MYEQLRSIVSLAVLAVAVMGCHAVEPESRTGTGVPGCYVIYDAGSSRTRLFVYEQTATGWTMHRGPATPALADPVRGNRGKTMADADSTIDALVRALENMRSDGPPDDEGLPRWEAYDWQRSCKLEAAYVFGTAGMRIAERQDSVASDLVWRKVRHKLAEALAVPVTARTLSEFEEGLFAWLALSETQADTGFGVAELGGGSLQVTFPCRDCEDAKEVRVKGRSIEIFSRSFLGWGQDEIWKGFGQVAACERGAGVGDPAWRIEDCEAVMRGLAEATSEVAGHIGSSAGLRWYLSDAFFFMQDDDIENFCRKGLDSGYEPESSCFRAIYQKNVLKHLGLPPDAVKSAASWTLGAVVCAATRCLESGRAD